MTDAPERIWIDPHDSGLGWAVSDDEVTADDVAYLRADLCARDAILEEAAQMSGVADQEDLKDITKRAMDMARQIDLQLAEAAYAIGRSDAAAAIRAVKEAK